MPAAVALAARPSVPLGTQRQGDGGGPAPRSAHGVSGIRGSNRLWRTRRHARIRLNPSMREIKPGNPGTRSLGQDCRQNARLTGRPTAARLAKKVKRFSSFREILWGCPEGKKSPIR